PLLWVVRYVDRSRTYGLGFLLSNGSVVVHFKDSTKMVLGPDGVGFEYVGRLNKAKANRARYTIKSYPPDLAKKVTLLHRFRKHLHNSQAEKGKRTGVTVVALAAKVAAAATASVVAAAVAVTAAAEAGGGGEGGDAVVGLGQEGQGKEGDDDWTIVDDHRRTRHSSLFLLSNSTAQV
ncbi:unnamed protein product, partial [Laminaria digitata]